MAALFLWPPVVKYYNSNSSYAYYFLSDTYADTQALPVFWTSNYYGLADNNNGSYNYQTYAQSYISAGSASLSTGFVATRTGGATNTTSNGRVFTINTPSIIAPSTSVDFGAEMIWLISGSDSILFDSSYIYLNGSSYGPPTTAAPSPVRAVKVAATKYTIFYAPLIQTGSSMGSPVYSTFSHYTTVDTSTSTFSAAANVIPGVQNTVSEIPWEIVDAGEGYFYFFYAVNGFMGVRGVDLATGTASTTALLGGSGVTGWATSRIRNSRVRYVTIGATRYVFYQTTSFLVRIAFTAGTKGAPTITKLTTKTCTGGDAVLEFDPASGLCYVVNMQYSGAASYAAAYTDPLVDATSYSAYVAVASVVHQQNLPVVRQSVAASACLGDAYNSVALTGVSASFGYPGTVGIAYSCWHTPVNYAPSVNIDRTNYGGVTIGRLVSKPRGASAGTGYASVTSGIALASAFASTYQWALSSSSVYTYGVTCQSTYSSVSSGAVKITVVEGIPLTQRWLNVGYTWMDDFMVYLNQDRSALGLPAYRTWGADGQWLTRRDVANLHSFNMARVRVHAHEDAGFPVLQQSIAQRGDLVPTLGIAENIQFGPVANWRTNSFYGYTTAYDAWLNWHNSPPHYANMTRDWGANADKVYSMIGVSEGLGDLGYVDGGGDPIFADYVCNYLCNNFVLLELLMFEIPFTQYWGNNGALIASMDQQWSNSAWSHVAARHTVPYSMRVASSSFTANWGCRVATQHTVPVTYSLVASLSAPYSQAAPIPKAQNTAGYAIKDTTTVMAQASTPFALRVARQNQIVHALLTPIQAQVESGYAIKDTQPVAAQSVADFSIRVAAQHAADHALLLRASSQSEAGYAIKNTQPVAVQKTAEWSVRVAAVHEAGFSYLTRSRASNEVGYAIKNTQPVLAQADASYGIRVAAQNEAVFTYLGGVRNSAESGYSIKNTQPVSAQSDARYGIGVAAQNTAGFSYLVQTHAQTEVGYAVKSTQPVLAQHQLGYALRVSTQNEIDFNFQLTVRAEVSSPYAVKSTGPVSAENSLPFAMRVSATNELGWGFNVHARAQAIAPYGDVVHVRSQAQSAYALLVSNPIKVSMAHYYAMQDYVSQVAMNNTVTVILADGQRIRVDDCVIDSASGDVGYRFECAIADLSTFSALQEDDPITVDFCGELYYFFVDTKSMSRNSPSDVVLRITANNEVMREGSPYRQATDYIQEENTDASALINGLVDTVVSYEVVDWTILGGRLQVAGATPLEAATQIAEAVGAVVDGSPTGTMRIRYPYPVAMNAIESATVDQTYSDDYDNLSVAVSTIYRDGATRFRVREGNASFSDSFAWVPDAVQADPLLQTGIIKAYLSPYRNTATIKHLGNASYVIPIGEESELHEEVIEFNEGVGNTSRPVETLISTVWVTASMGVPSYAPFSTLLNVNPTVNNGYGLAKVTYNARHLTAKAGGIPANVDANNIGPASSYAYFVLEESNG